MIAQLAICQSGYPKLIKIDSDTIVAFTPKQAKQLDLYRIDLKYKSILSDSLLMRISKCDELVGQQQILIQTHKEQLNDYSSLMVVYNQQLDEQNKRIDQLTKKVNKRGATVKIFGVGLVVSTAVIVGFLLN